VTLNVTTHAHDGWTVLLLNGELDLVTSSVIRQHVHDAVAEGRRSLVLDLSDVQFCDTSGVSVLVGARRLMRSCAGRLRLVLPARGDLDGSHLNRVLSTLGVRRLFDVYPDLPTALNDQAHPIPA
jgi:anti-sigma B factor antagonist